MAQTPDEKTYVEIPFIEQLKGMGWEHIEGDIDVPYLTERESFRDVLLTGRLRKAIKEINRDAEGKPWLDDERANEVTSRLERISAPKLLEANRQVFDLIVRGYWFAPDHQETGPGLLEDKRLPLRRLYAYRIKSDYDAVSVDKNNLADLLQTVKQVIDIIDERGGG